MPDKQSENQVWIQKLIKLIKSAVMTASGRPFQTWAAATGKAQLPTVDSLMGGMTMRLVLADLTARWPNPRYRGARGLTTYSHWLPVHRDQLQAQRLVTSIGSLYPFLFSCAQECWNRLIRRSVGQFDRAATAVVYTLCQSVSSLCWQLRDNAVLSADMTFCTNKHCISTYTQHIIHVVTKTTLIDWMIELWFDVPLHTK